MHSIVYPRYTLVEKIVMGLLSLITWPLQWIVGKTREKIRELDMEEQEE